MDLSISFETGQNSSAAPSKKGRFRNALRRFAKRKKTTSVQTPAEIPPEPVADLSVVDLAVADLPVADLNSLKSKILVQFGQAMLTGMHFVMFALGVIGGIYAILRILNVDIFNDDIIEIKIRRN